MRRRILTSILLVIGAIVLTLGVPLAVVSWKLVSDLVRQELSSRLNAIATSISAQAADSGDIDLHRLELAVPDRGQLLIRMADNDDQTVGDPITGDAVSEELVLPGGGFIRLSVPADTMRGEQVEALLLVGLAVLLSVLVGAVVAILTARRLATPLTDVASRAARLGSGDFRPSRRRYGVAELDRVAEVLDSSADDIAALLRRERDLASDISHQLRTRLTGLQLRLEELSAHPDPAVVQEVQAALDQTDRLVTVVDDLLANARSQRAAGASELVLTGELHEVATGWQSAFARVRRSLVVECPADTTVRATSVRLREALGVLIDNALTHGAGTVHVTVRPGGPTMVVVEVSDEGPGVADALVGHIFDRGVSTASSTGIGLGVARAFIEADGGRLELRHPRPPVFGIFLAMGGPLGGTADDDGELVDEAPASGELADDGGAAAETADEEPTRQPTDGTDGAPGGSAPGQFGGLVLRTGATLAPER